MELESILLTPPVLVISAATVATIYFIGQAPVGASTLSNISWWRRILPVLPIMFGIGAAFLPGVLVGDDGDPMAWGNRLLVGAWSGLVAAQGRKIIKRLTVEKIVPKD
jgi:hypothetical protein